uniref:Uncharacterized protein n=1 Tax=Anguilla anguilla TaxID=7936 RepID=A0A0E9RLL2_ANGAN
MFTVFIMCTKLYYAKCSWTSTYKPNTVFQDK